MLSKEVVLLGKLDAVSKQYFGRQDAFADVFNYLLFDGKQVIRPDDLKELDSNQVAVLLKDKDLQEIQKQRDLFRLWTAMTDGHAIFILLGAEIQGSVHYAMPIKAGLYDFITYDDQLSEIASRNRQLHKTKEFELEGGEYLYGFRKDDRVKLVITATIYVGKETWDGPLKLSDIIEEESRKYLINDYKLCLLSATDLPEQDFGKFKTELGDIMRFVKHQGEDVDKLIEQTNHKIYSPEAAAFVKEAANMDLDFEVKNGGVDMCEALERRYSKERQTAKDQMIKKLLQNGVDESIIADSANVTVEYVIKIKNGELQIV